MEIDRLNAKFLETERERDELLDRNKDKNRELYEAKNVFNEQPKSLEDRHLYIAE